MLTSPQPLLPGQHLEALLRDKGLNQTEAATRLNMNRTYLNGVINGKHLISADLKLKLKDLLGVPTEYWADVERDVQRWQSTEQGQAEVRTRSQEDLYTMLDIRGHHVLVDHEIRQALRSQVISISPFDLGHEEVRERLRATTVELTFGETAFVHSADMGDSSVSLRGGLTLKRGKMATFETRERITLTSRVRAVVNGLVSPWNGAFTQLFSARVLEPGTGGVLSFGLLNNGIQDLLIEPGQACLSISFEYLAQDCTT
jgi:plasmid maintenance system antidote protein VapI/deoxycytidine triphosphate deaminase